MTNAYVVNGTLTDSNTLTLDEPLPIESTKVRIVIEPVRDELKRPMIAVLEEIWAEQRRDGHIPPTREAVDEQIRRERESWDDR